MTITAEKEYQHIGESAGCADHDHDLVHELSRRLDTVWRLDQYIANAEGDADLKSMWQDIKDQEMNNVQRIKKMVTEHVQKNCF